MSFSVHNYSGGGTLTPEPFSLCSLMIRIFNAVALEFYNSIPLPPLERAGILLDSSPGKMLLFSGRKIPFAVSQLLKSVETARHEDYDDLNQDDLSVHDRMLSDLNVDQTLSGTRNDQWVVFSSLLSLLFILSQPDDKCGDTDHAKSKVILQAARKVQSGVPSNKCEVK